METKKKSSSVANGLNNCKKQDKNVLKNRLENEDETLIDSLMMSSNRRSSVSHLAAGAYEKIYQDWPVFAYALYWLLFTVPYMQLARSLIGYRPIYMSTLFELSDMNASERKRLKDYDICGRSRIDDYLVKSVFKPIS